MAADPAAANIRDPQQTQAELEGKHNEAPRDSTDGPEFEVPRQKAHHEDEVVLEDDFDDE
jgi:hypothetical protein